MNANELEDDWANDDFFRAGERGSEESALHSLAPVALEEAPPRVLDEAWLARRARHTRLVAWTIGSLGLFALLAPLAQAQRARFGALAHTPAEVTAAPLVAPRSTALEALPATVALSPSSPSAGAAEPPVVRHALHARPPGVAKSRTTGVRNSAALPVPVATPANRAPRSLPSVARFPDPS